MEQTYEQMEIPSQTVKTEKDKGDSSEKISYGKFKDANALMTAYSNLEAEFTRRSKRLRELEKELERSVEENGKILSENGRKHQQQILEYSTQIETLNKRCEDAESKLKDKNFLKTAIDGDQTVKEQIVREYLKGIITKKPSVSLGGGGAIVAPPKKPKTLAEASQMAREYIKVKGET